MDGAALRNVGGGQELAVPATAKINYSTDVVTS
jgi:hypothetical protein